MASRGDIQAGKATVELKQKDSFSKEFNRSLNRAKQSLREFGAQARAAGSTLAFAGTAIVAPLAALVLSTEAMQQRMKDVQSTLQSGIAPALTPIVSQVQEIAAGLGVIAGRNPEIVQSVFKWGAGIAAASAGLSAFAKTIKFVWAGVSVVTSLITAVGVAFVAAASAAVAAWLWAANNFLKYTSEGQEVAYQMGRKWEDMKAKMFGVADATRDAGKAALEAAKNQRAMEEAVKATAEQSERMSKSITAAFGKRQNLINEFMNNRERYLAKEQEIFDALAQLQKNRNLNFIGDGEYKQQRAGLEEALRRNRAKEAERLAGLAPKAEKEKVEKEAKVKDKLKAAFDTTASSFSANGAMALGFGGGGGIQQQTLAEAKAQRKLAHEQLKETRRQNYLLEHIRPKVGT